MVYNKWFMIRQRYRAELREAIKSLQKAEKTPLFKAMTKYFNSLSAEDYDLLKELKHTNEKKQNEFNGFARAMKGYVELKTRVEYLQSLRPVSKDNG